LNFAFLPIEVKEALIETVENHIYELRFRLNQPVLVNVKGVFYEIEKNKLVLKANNSLKVSKQMLENIIFKASSGSVYAYTEQIKQGFLTTLGGVRIGICGEVVMEQDKVLHIKNISSINIRIPHEVINCALPIFPYLIENKSLYNTLIISPPGAGKTTMLRDIAYQISKFNTSINTLILDERYEISGSVNGVPQLNIGQADIILGGKKQQNFEAGIRSMSPQIILCDEIATKSDIEAILYAFRCGIRIIATTHASSETELKTKHYFKTLLQKKVFNRFVVLSNNYKVGTIEGVYDANFKKINKEKSLCNLSLV